MTTKKYKPPKTGTEGRPGDSVPLFERKHYQKPAKKHKTPKVRVVNFVLFGILTVVVLGALSLFFVFREDISRDSIRRITSRISASFQEHGALSADVISFDSQLDNVLKPFEDGLTVLTSNRFVWYDAIGNERLSAERTFKRPALQVSDRNVLAYDRNGTTLLLANRNDFLLDIQWEKPIINARLNKNGWTALVSQGAGYKAVVTVLDKNGEAVFKYYSPDYYVLDAAVSPDNKMLAVAYAGYQDSWVGSRMRLYSLSSEEPIATATLGDCLISELLFSKNDRVIAVTEHDIRYWDATGEQLGKTTLADRKLLDYSLLDDCIVLRTARNYSGMNSQLESYDFTGEPLGTLTLLDDVVCQSGNGERVALVTVDEISLYDETLTLVTSEPNDTFVRQVLQRENGSMFFIYNDNARLFTP